MSLPTSFSGTSADTLPRVIAFSIDVVLVVVISVTAAVLASPVLGAVLAAEALLGVWMLQARLGVTPGSAMVGLRVSREDGPFSPGAGRSFVRGLLVLLSALVLLAGAWVVVASAAWDRSGRRRSWLDKASETVVVAVPARAGRTSADGPALASPTVQGRASASGLGASSRPAAPAIEPGVLLAPEWGSPIVIPPRPELSPGAPASVGISAVAAPGVAATRQPDVAPGADAAAARTLTAQLLIVFDTGQRVQLALPAAVNLGRNPAATDPADALVAVEDPDRMVSKTHVRLEHDGETAWVTDAGSTNGSELVDEDGIGRPLAPGVRTLLDDGMRVRIGERIFTVSRLIGGPA